MRPVMVETAGNCSVRWRAPMAAAPKEAMGALMRSRSHSASLAGGLIRWRGAVWRMNGGANVEWFRSRLTR